MRKTRVSSVDLDTGEMLDYTLVAVQQKRRNGFRDGWVAMSQSAMEMLASSELRGEDLRVLLLLMARLDFENLISVEQVELAKKLNMKAPNINRSIKRLVALGTLLEGPKIGRSRTYRLNPNYGWKGSAKNHQAAQQAQRKAELAGFQIIEGGRSDSSEK